MFASIIAAIRGALAGLGRGLKTGWRWFDTGIHYAVQPIYWTLFAATLPFQWVASALTPKIAGNGQNQDMDTNAALAATTKLLAEAKARKSRSAPKLVAVEDLLPMTTADQAFLIKRYAAAICEGRNPPDISRLAESERAWAEIALFDYDHAKNLNSATRSAIENHMSGRRFMPHLSPLPDAAWLSEARRGYLLEDKRIKAEKAARASREIDRSLEDEFGYRVG